MKKLNRREFMGVAGSAMAISVIPRHVMGGSNFVAPSDKINIGLIGAGTQQLSELTRLITDDRVQIVSLCDPNREPVNYRAWSPDAGLRRRIREMTGDSNWYEGTQITAGRDCGHSFVNKYYAKKTGQTNYSGCSAYADFREKQSPGNLLSAGVVNETALLAMVALRAGGRIQYDPSSMRVTTPGNADQYLHRAHYRPGWQL